MKQILIILTFFLALLSCSKNEECWCNAGDGEYKYFPSYTTSGSYGHSGDLKQECEIEERSLKENVGNSSYCEMK